MHVVVGISGASFKAVARVNLCGALRGLTGPNCCACLSKQEHRFPVVSVLQGRRQSSCLSCCFRRLCSLQRSLLAEHADACVAPLRRHGGDHLPGVEHWVVTFDAAQQRIPIIPGERERELDRQRECFAFAVTTLEVILPTGTLKNRMLSRSVFTRRWRRDALGGQWLLRSIEGWSYWPRWSSSRS